MLKHHEGNPAIFQVLLLPDIFVRRYHDFETGLFGNVDQFPVREFFPSASPRFLHRMASEETGEASRCAVVEKNQHPGFGLCIRWLFIEGARHECHEAVDLLTRHRELLHHFFNAHA